MLNKQRLTPIKFIYSKNNKSYWLFTCQCGNEIERPMNAFRSGNTKSCGCLITNPPINNRAKDHTGKKFNRLLALIRFKKRNKQGISQIYYECLCDCGNKKSVLGAYLQNNNTKSCGCLDRENLIKRNKDPIAISKRSNTLNKKYIIFHWKTNEKIYCTGSWEFGVIKYLNHRKINFEWQKIFDLPNGTRYICDLYLIQENKYIEVKGRWLKDAWDKVQLFRNTYPNLNLEIWDRSKLFLMNIINNQGKII